MAKTIVDIASRVDPVEKAKAGVRLVIMVVFIILAIILIPTGISLTLGGNFRGGLSSLIIGGAVGYGAYRMLF
jgi:hypothetical protein